MNKKENNEQGYNKYVQVNDNEDKAVTDNSQIKRKHREGKGHFYRFRGMAATAVVLVMLFSCASLIALNLYGTTNYYKNQLENRYQRSFYDLTDNMSNLEVKLSKLLVSNSPNQIQKNLNDVAKQTESTQMNLSELPTTHETIYKTMRFVNQLGDYSNVLANKLATGNKLNEGNYETLENLYQVNRKLSTELFSMAERLGGELKLIYDNNGGAEINPFSDSLNNMQENSIDYPSMIYDGPFSDGLLNAELKGLKGSDVTKEEAEQNLADFFKDFSIAEISFTGESAGKISTYNFNVMLTNGDDMYVQMSKIGGNPVLLDNKRALENYSFEVDECIEKAEYFIQSLGYKDMKSVWASDYNGSVYVNIAPYIGGIIYYPDLIKVIVARDNGEILGLETMSYLANHTERSLPSPALTKLQARKKTSDKIRNSIKSEKLTLIPIDGGKETLAWEFAAEWNDLKYFIYIDAQTGEEVNVFRVIDSEQGTLII